MMSLPQYKSEAKISPTQVLHLLYWHHLEPESAVVTGGWSHSVNIPPTHHKTTHFSIRFLVSACQESGWEKLKIGIRWGEAGKETARSVTKESSAMWHRADAARNYKTSENKDQDSCPVWAITAVTKSSTCSEGISWLEEKSYTLCAKTKSVTAILILPYNMARFRQEFSIFFVVSITASVLVKWSVSITISASHSFIWKSLQSLYI